MKSYRIWFALALVVLAGAAVAISIKMRRRADDAAHPSTDAAHSQTNGTLTVYCAPGMRPPVEAIAKEYESAYGVQIQLSYLPSQALIATVEAAKTGDLIIPADDFYVQLARSKSLIAETIPLATMKPVLAVKQGNPKKIQGLADLLKSEVAVSLANPDTAAVSRLVREKLGTAWGDIQAHAKVVKPTVTDAATDVKLGTADAAFIWDATVAQFKPAFDTVSVPELDSAKSDVSISVLKSAKDPTRALHFARYLASRDKGNPQFAATGYGTVEGDVWEDHPRILFYSGAMLRPAIEKTLDEFEKREGATITRVYNGCGILVAQMKAGEKPDAYFSCDRSFMAQVKDKFGPSTDVSANDILIVVPKDNPKNIKTIQDLASQPLRLGVAHEQQSALGALTKNLLLETGLYDQVRKNVVVETPTADMLMSQLLAGSLDAAIVYVSNVAASKDKVLTFRIDTPKAHAVQPYAVHKDSTHRQIMQRLQAAIESAQSRQRFLSIGFTWELKK